MEVKNSTIGVALSRYGRLSETLCTEIRKQASIDTLCEAVTSNKTSEIEPCDNKYCLFNIVEDPCETYDLSYVHEDILNGLLIELADFNSTVIPVPVEILKADPNAHPKYWHNYWSPWLDKQHSNASSLICSIDFLIQIITLLVILTVNYCLCM